MILNAGRNSGDATKRRSGIIPDEFDRLRTLAQRGRITLVFSAHDEAHNDAVVLKDLLLEHT
jgi:uncharacterized protein YeaO (DUF488 family)